MSVNQQDLDPDSTTDVEDVADAEEELIKKCEEMWKDMEECQNKLSLTGTETLTDSNIQLSLLIMQVKCLTAELSQWQKETPERTANKHIVQWWFKKFSKGDESLEDEEHMAGHQKLTTTS
uniref:Centromere protein K n=1 Tax=Ovis aries TaxID=9940 RepID=A0AC11EQJ2_SHEEP